jgi:hypothetical protein
MTAVGHLRTFGESKRMSALPPKADIYPGEDHVRFGANTCRCQLS